MSELFYFDKQKDLKLSYNDILNSINSLSYYKPYFKAKNEIEFYVNFIKALCTNGDITLIDIDFSNEEIKDLIAGEELLQKKVNTTITFDSLDQLQSAIISSSSKITLFTSGTTGQPKKITHPVSHFIKSARLTPLHRGDKWAFAYNPSHMAGLQVFFQAFLNQNLLINLFNKSKKDIVEQIEFFELTNISATPTFYRLLFPFSQPIHSMKKVTLGGEKSDERLIHNISNGFPKAKIFNIYASTEAGALFIAKSDRFQLDDKFVGKAKIIDGELLLHNSLLGQSESINTEWFHTGDIVELLLENPLTFKFISRKNEMINVGGNNVNPSEVESKILSYPGIEAAKVYGRANSVMGNILVADVVKSSSEITDLAIKEFLKSHLQGHKIPRIIKFVETLELTRTGKVSRL
jgi:acyl-coenzyme A synthetase/AMP-(fatty) acid ligase